MACSSADTEPPAKRTDEALLLASGTTLTAPDCLSPNTPKHSAWALPHTTSSSPGYLTQYTSRFPAVGAPAPYAAYESSVWSIPRANGYMYLVHVDFTGNQNQAQYVFLAGIRDRNASPPYLLQPPSPGNVRMPQPPAPFAATDADYTSEVNLAAANPALPIAAAPIQCVTVYDNGGNVLDYFPLADTHDPSVGPW
jgi:hypothetical protein